MLDKEPQVTAVKRQSCTQNPNGPARASGTPFTPPSSLHRPGCPPALTAADPHFPPHRSHHPSMLAPQGPDPETLPGKPHQGFPPEAPYSLTTGRCHTAATMLLLALLMLLLPAVVAPCQVAFLLLVVGRGWLQAAWAKISAPVLQLHSLPAQASPGHFDRQFDQLLLVVQRSLPASLLLLPLLPFWVCWMPCGAALAVRSRSSCRQPVISPAASNAANTSAHIKSHTPRCLKETIEGLTQCPHIHQPEGSTEGHTVLNKA